MLEQHVEEVGEQNMERREPIAVEFGGLVYVLGKSRCKQSGSGYSRARAYRFG